MHFSHTRNFYVRKSKLVTLNENFATVVCIHNKNISLQVAVLIPLKIFLKKKINKINNSLIPYIHATLTKSHFPIASCSIERFL